jgi:hypothetical protein
MHGQQAGGFLDRQRTVRGGCYLEADQAGGTFAKHKRAGPNDIRLSRMALDICIAFVPVQKNLA